MEKKNGLGIAFLFMVIGILIATIIGLSIWVYTLKKEEPKQEEPKQEELEQEELTPQTNNIEFSDIEIKECLQNYLNLVGMLNNEPDNVIRYLFANAQIDYGASDVEHYLKTNISYDRFKATILNYMSEKGFVEFNKVYNGEESFKNVDGLVYALNTGASGDHWDVDTIEKIGNNKYIGHTTWIFEGLEETKKSVNFQFTITSYNGKCVIDSCEQVENISNESSANKNSMYTITTKNDEYGDTVYATITATKDGKEISKEMKMDAQISRTGTMEIPNVGEFALVAETGGEYLGVHCFQLIDGEIKDLGIINCGADMVKEATYTAKIKDETIVEITATRNDETKTAEFNNSIAKFEPLIIDIFDYGKVVLVPESGGEYYGITAYRLSQDYTSGKTLDIIEVGTLTGIF